MMQAPISTFIEALSESLNQGIFVKLTLSKPTPKTAELRNVYGRLVAIQGHPQLSFTYRYTTRDETHNAPFEDALEQIQTWLGKDFLIATLRTTAQDYVLQYNKKRRARLQRQKPSIRQAPSLEHNRTKHYAIEEDAPFLDQLGIAHNGNVLKAHQDKFRQINKYVEIMAGLLPPAKDDAPLRIVDMGSGKGYLTFALYHYLLTQNRAAQIVGIELRKPLVEFCNAQAQALGWSGLSFRAQDIYTYDNDAIDILIALHACDTATDLAIAKGIQAQANVIVVAPCCHRQVRRSMLPPTAALHGLLKHGIQAERQAELLTDGIRALLLETQGYQTKVFEFIQSDHTAKNTLITAQRSNQPAPQHQAHCRAQVEALKTQFGIQEHYLQTLLQVQCRG